MLSPPETGCDRQAFHRDHAGVLIPVWLMVGIAVSNVENHLLGGLGDLQRGKQNLIFKRELFNLKNRFSPGLIDSQLVPGSRTVPWVPAK